MKNNYTKKQILQALHDISSCTNKWSRMDMDSETFEIAKFCMEVCLITNETDLKNKREEYVNLSKL